MKSGASITRHLTPISPWVDLETVTVTVADGTAPQTFHALRQADYVQVLCLHEAGDVVLVRQFRPVLETETFEFPGGLRDADEPYDETARREVGEETGLTVTALVPLIETFVDVGRLTNRFIGYFALVSGELVQREADVEPLLVSGERVLQLAVSGQLTVPGQIGLLYLAAVNPKVAEICARCGVPNVPWMSRAGGG